VKIKAKTGLYGYENDVKMITSINIAGYVVRIRER